MAGMGALIVIARKLVPQFRAAIQTGQPFFLSFGSIASGRFSTIASIAK